MNLLLNSAIALSAGAALQAVRAGEHPRRFYLLKPLTTALILASAALAPPRPARGWVVGGLVLSLIGDICLMFPGNRAFLGGLGSFLAAHLAFIAAFSVGLPPGLPPLWTVGLGCYALAMLTLLWPRTGRLRIPVAIYGLVLFAMALAAARAHHLLGTPASLWGVAGALTFIASDSALAANRFLRPHRRAQLVILGTYWMALACLVKSLH
ncbi:MAG: lysoplasmalogenase [Acidobacteria bacterium]|nr:lysoplasmalogenase [Acidobacteriota bacterium]